MEQEDLANQSIYDHQIHLLDGTPVSFSKYSGKVLLIVNVASE